MIAQQLLNALVVGSVYALFALGFTLIFGVHHILNLAHGAVFMWGAFVGLYAVFGLRVTLLQVTIVMSVAIIVAALFAYMFYTGFGRQIRAVAVNERTASLLGVNPTAVYFQTFFISGALAGAAGVLIGIAF